MELAIQSQVEKKIKEKSISNVTERNWKKNHKRYKFNSLNHITMIEVNNTLGKDADIEKYI